MKRAFKKVPKIEPPKSDLHLFRGFCILDPIKTEAAKNLIEKPWE
jgi:hypothetical protein